MGRPPPTYLVTLPSLFDVEHEEIVFFGAPPDYVWESLKRTDLFEDWWSWIRDVRLEGEALEADSTISFTIEPPIPYHFHIAVDVVEADPGHFLRGDIRGDLAGDATFELEESDGGSRVRIAWDVHITSPLIRPVIFIARPILIRAQHWAVDVALRGFRRHLRNEGYED